MGAICLLFAGVVAILGLTARVKGPESVVDMRSTAVLPFLAMGAVCFGLATFSYLKH